MSSSEPSTWENSLNPQLVRRLASPLSQPGIANHHMATEIVERSQSFANRLPLLDQQMQRWMSITEVRSQHTPIVYAQPDSEVAGMEGHGDVGTREPREGAVPNDFLSSPSAVSDGLLPLNEPGSEGGQPIVVQSKAIEVNHNKRTQGLEPKMNLVEPIVESISTTPISDSQDGIIQRKLEMGGRGDAETQGWRDGNSDAIFPLPPTAVSDGLLPYSDSNSQVSSTSGQELPVSAPVGIITAVPVASSQQTVSPSSIDNADLPLVQGKLGTSDAKSLLEVAPLSSPRHPVTPSPHQSFSQSERMTVVQAVDDLLPNQAPTLVFTPIAIARPNSRIPDQVKSLTPQPVTTNNQASPQSTMTSQALTNPSESSPPHSLHTTVTSPAMPPPSMDINAVAAQVERKLKRRLVIESERRGKKRWR